jgi:hypothetical protein
VWKGLQGANAVALQNINYIRKKFYNIVAWMSSSSWLKSTVMGGGRIGGGFIFLLLLSFMVVQLCGFLQMINIIKA